MPKAAKQAKPHLLAPAPPPSGANLAKIIETARHRYPVFVSTCFRDETGKMIRVQPYQYEWIRLCAQHPRLIIWCPPEHGKSVHFSFLYPLWLLAHRPNLRIVIVSETAGQAKKFGRAMRETIERNQAFKVVFPHVRPGRPWTDARFTIQRPLISKDPSVECIGVFGAILGARVDMLILDDILSIENTYTRAQRDKVFKWLQSTFLTRLTERGRVVGIGVKWTEDDAFARLIKDSGYVSREYPAFKADGTPLWPEKWPKERLEAKKKELSPFEWRRQYLLDLTPEAGDFIKAEWIEEAKQRGQAVDPFKYEPEPGERIVCGIDFGARKEGDAGRTAFHVLAVAPKRLTTLAAKAGHFSATEIRDQIRMYAGIWPTLVCAAESNATQSLIVDLLRASLVDVPVFAVVTTRKVYQKEGDIYQIARHFSNGEWRIATPDNPGIKDWLFDLVSYTGGHMPDTLAACVFARQVGLQLVDNEMEVKQPKKAKKQPQQAALVLWGDNKSIARLAGRGKIEMLPPSRGPAPTFVVGTTDNIEDQGPWDLPTIPFETLDVSHSNEGARWFRRRMIVINDPVLREALDRLGTRNLRQHTSAWPVIALTLAVRAGAMMRSGYSTADVESPKKAPAPTTQQSAPELTWDLLEQLGMPSPRMINEMAEAEIAARQEEP